MLSIPSDVPDAIARLLVPAEKLGAAFCLIRDDHVLGANREHQALYPNCDFSNGCSFDHWFYKSLEGGYTVNEEAATDPAGALHRIKISRRGPEELVFPKRHPSGRLIVINTRFGKYEAQIRLREPLHHIENTLPATANVRGVLGIITGFVERNNFELMLDSVGVGICILDKGGFLINANRSFREIIARNDGLILDINGTITTSDERDAVMLRHLMNMASEVEGPFVLPVRRPHGPPYMASIVMEKKIIMKIAERRRELEWVDGVFQSWGMTPAEASVASNIGDGLSIKDVSEKNSVVIGTVRNQLQSAYKALARSDLDVNCQRDLAILTGQLSAVAGPNKMSYISIKGANDA